MFLNQTNGKQPTAYFTPLMTFKRKLTLGYFITLILLSSCVPFKEVQLLQEMAESEYAVTKPNIEYKIQSSDLLHIDVKFLDTSTKDYFTKEQIIAAGGGGGSGSAQLYFSDYLVDYEGMIDLPAIGKLSVVGKTTHQVAQEIEVKLKALQKLNTVSVKLSNFKVTMLGEIGSPGTQYVYEQNYHLIHAITNAGGFTDFSNRKKVRLIRETDKGVKTIWFDLTDPKVFSSDYFYLQPNDMVYVEPLKAKTIKSNIQNIGIGISIVSLVTTLLALFSR